MNMTKHAESRCKQRGINKDALAIIENFGRAAYAPGGALKIHFGNKEFSKAIRELKNLMKRLERARGGTLIIVDDRVLTTYKK